jgi:hypothetical protein
MQHLKKDSLGVLLQYRGYLLHSLKVIYSRLHLISAIVLCFSFVTVVFVMSWSPLSAETAPSSTEPPKESCGGASTEASLSGQELAQKVHDRDKGEDSVSEEVMELVSEGGRRRTRELTVYTKDCSGLQKTLIRFNSPADIAGTGFLSIEKEDGETEQFLYLPSLRRTRRIVSSQKSRSFVNSDFSYEDMERRPVGDSDHQITGEEKVGNVSCHVLETRPKAETNSQYSLIKSWVAAEIDVPVKAEYYDKKGNLIKKYRVSKLENIQDIWTETEVMMEDLSEKHQTFLRTQKIVYNTNLRDDVLTRQNMETW